MEESIIEQKSFEFAVKIVKVCRFLSEEMNERVLSKQLLRSGTSIGANVSEAERGQSTADFHAKMCIALKEANESEYWIRLLKESDYLTDENFNMLESRVKELIRLLTAICKTVSSKSKK